MSLSFHSDAIPYHNSQMTIAPARIVRWFYILLALYLAAVIGVATTTGLAHRVSLGVLYLYSLGLFLLLVNYIRRR